METELKLELAPEHVAQLAASPILAAGTAAAPRRLVSTYFDTRDDDLRRAGFTLRVRQDGARRVQTVKAEGSGAAGLFVRPEWEREVTGDLPTIDAATGPVAELLGGRRLEPRFVTEVLRTERLLDWQDARIDLALDMGEVRAGSMAQPLAELELELRDGPASALFGLARALDEAAPLRLGVQSKSERGHRLAEPGRTAAVKADPVTIDAGGDTIQGFVAIAHACLRQFRLNEVLLLGGDHGAAPLHQARVALRRLRSALSLFRPVLEGDAEARRFAGELKELAGFLGAVRDLDVLIGRHDGAARDRLAEARAAAFATARERLEGPDTRHLMLDFAEWLAFGDWRTRPPDPALAHRAIMAFAADLLDRRRKRLKRRGKHLSGLDDDHRHQVRIEAKKLRYAAEFFAGLWRGRKAERRRKAFAAAIEALQEELGHLNDAAHGDTVLARLGLAPPPSEPTVSRHALVRAEAAYDDLREIKRFWR